MYVEREIPKESCYMNKICKKSMKRKSKEI